MTKEELATGLEKAERGISIVSKIGFFCLVLLYIVVIAAVWGITFNPAISLAIILFFVSQVKVALEKVKSWILQQPEDLDEAQVDN